MSKTTWISAASQNAKLLIVQFTTEHQMSGAEKKTHKKNTGALDFSALKSPAVKQETSKTRFVVTVLVLLHASAKILCMPVLWNFNWRILVGILLGHFIRRWGWCDATGSSGGDVQGSYFADLQASRMQHGGISMELLSQRMSNIMK